MDDDTSDDTAAATAAPATSLLDTGADGAPAGADPWSTVPEKFVTKAADGSVDQAATLSKLRDAHANLERRHGVGDTRPATASEYAFEVPPELADGFDVDDPELAEVRQAAFDKGLTGDQFAWAMSEYLKRAPMLANGGAALDRESATAALKTAWGEGDKFDANLKLAQLAATQIGGKELAAELERTAGNNPAVLQLLARVGAQLREDTPPGTTSHAPAVSVHDLMASEAYRTVSHPQHTAVTARVNAHFARQPGASDPVS